MDYASCYTQTFRQGLWGVDWRLCRPGQRDPPLCCAGSSARPSCSSRDAGMRHWAVGVGLMPKPKRVHQERTVSGLTFRAVAAARTLKNLGLSISLPSCCGKARPSGIQPLTIRLRLWPHSTVFWKHRTPLPGPARFAVGRSQYSKTTVARLTCYQHL
jgi:hypothetical protein